MAYEFDWSVIPEALPFLAQGMLVSLALLAASLVGGLALGIGLALMRLSSLRWVSALAGAYVSVFRSTPLVLAIFWFYLLVPLLIGAVRGQATPIGPMYSAFAAFVAFEAAYFCEVIRAGIQSIPRGQRSAAQALGLGRFQAMRYVILPQAFRRMLPPLGNNAIALLKDSSLISAIGLAELAYTARTVAGAYSRYWEPYLTISLMYWILTLGLAWAIKRLETRYGRGDTR